MATSLMIAAAMELPGNLLDILHRGVNVMSMFTQMASPYMVFEAGK